MGLRSKRWMYGLCAAVCLWPFHQGGWAAAPRKGFRILKVETKEVTQPGLAVTPDGASLVFNALGHLFSVPAKGGAATQLTFGFAYESEPVLSPDGKQVAFISDRDGSGGNVFVLDLATRRLTQLTREWQASTPRWSPDGKTVAYLRPLPPEEQPLGSGGPSFFGAVLRSEVRTVPSRGGKTTAIHTPQAFSTLFYLPDGRLGWAIAEPSTPPSAPTVRLEARAAEGQVTVLGAVPGLRSMAFGIPDAEGAGITFSSDKDIQHFTFSTKALRSLVPLTEGGASFALSKDGKALYFGDQGKLWQVKLPASAPEALTLSVSASLEARQRIEPSWTPGISRPTSPRAVLTPHVSPDGHRFIFMAAGFLYEQAGKGQPARRLFQGEAIERDPAFSPDGSKLAYAVSLNGRRELRVYDFTTRQHRTLYTVGGASWATLPAWSPDGTRVVFQRNDGLNDPCQVIAVRLADGQAETLWQTSGGWTARPHFTQDGQGIYVTARLDRQHFSAFYRVSLHPGSQPEPLTALKGHVNDGLVSPDGKWLAFRRNTDIYVAPLSQKPVDDTRIRLLTSECSRSFTFTPDGSAVVYTAGQRLWRQPVTGGPRQAMPIHLTLQPVVAPPVLVRQIRVLDLQKGRFTEPTSMLLQGGKIAWIGSEQGRTIPTGVTVVEGANRYAIPGIHDVHVHSTWANQMTSPDAFIAFGNTAVRDVGASLDLLNALRDRSESTLLPLPRYAFSGEIFEGIQPIWGDAFLQITNEREARTCVRRFKAWGTDFIKIYDSLPWHLQNAVADEAQKQGLRVAGHALPYDKLVRHVLQGYDSMEHGSPGVHEDALKLMAAGGTRWVGTLGCLGGALEFIHHQPERLNLDLIRQYVPKEKLATARTGGLLFGMPKEVMVSVRDATLASAHAAIRAGVKVGAGTDAQMTEVFFGLSQHWELEFYRMAGMTTLETLRLGTLGGAETMGAQKYLGSLEPGKLADVVILDADPLENIQNTLKIWKVVKGGAVFDPKTMREDKDR